MAISMLKIRRPLGRLIFNMGIAIPGKTVFLIETAPWSPTSPRHQQPWYRLYRINRSMSVTMMTSSNGKKKSALLAHCVGNPPVTDIIFDLRLNKRFSKPPRRRWFETPSCPLWRHCNGIGRVRTICAISALKNGRKCKYDPLFS